MILNSPFSTCHINTKSMSRNFKAFEPYLAGLRFEFAFIGVSDTWLTDKIMTYSTYLDILSLNNTEVEKRVVE